MKRMSVTMTTAAACQIENLRKQQGFNSTSQCINYIISNGLKNISVPEIKKSKKVSDVQSVQNLNNEQTGQPATNSDTLFSQEQIQPNNPYSVDIDYDKPELTQTNTTSVDNSSITQNDEKEISYSNIHPNISGETAYEIRLKASELGLTVTQYLIMCHKKTQPIILDYDKTSTDELVSRFDELKKSVLASSNAVISILRNSGNNTTQSDISLVEDNQNQILQKLEDIKLAMKSNIQTIEKNQKAAVKEIKAYLKKHHKDSFVKNK